MESKLPATLEARLLHVWRANARLGGDEHKKPDDGAAPNEPAPHAPAKPRVEFDPLSGRFVHSLLSAETEEVLSRYPRQGELEFSRAISAYLRVLRESQ